MERHASQPNLNMLLLSPRQIKGVEEHSLLDEMVLHLPSDEVILSLNHSARTVWELCDKERTIEEIGREIQSLYGKLSPKNFDELLSDVWLAVKMFSRYGFIKLIDADNLDVDIREFEV